MTPEHWNPDAPSQDTRITSTSLSGQEPGAAKERTEGI
jgi:hypothetical protein